MNRLVTCRNQRRDPTRREIHIYQEPHPSTGHADLASLGEAGGEGEGLADIRFFKIWEVGQEILECRGCTDCRPLLRDRS